MAEPAAQPSPIADTRPDGQRWLRAVPDLDAEAAGDTRGDGPGAFPWS